MSPILYWIIYFFFLYIFTAIFLTSVDSIYAYTFLSLCLLTVIVYLQLGVVSAEPPSRSETCSADNIENFRRVEVCGSAPQHAVYLWRALLLNS